MQIVLVEDEEILLKSLTFFLKNQNFTVHPFTNGLDAINFIKENSSQIDLVITDLNLPFAGGKEVVHFCKNLENHQPKILVLTASGVENTEIELFDLGADDFMVKPFSPAVLLKRIQRIMP